MIKELVNKIINSDFMVKVREMINGLLDKFGSSSVKEKVDNFVDEDHSEKEEGIFANFTKKVQKFVNKHLSGKIKSNKLLKVIGKIVSTILSLGFSALVIYIMIKLLPEIIMLVAIIFAITVSLELIMAILNRAAKPIKINID